MTEHFTHGHALLVRGALEGLLGLARSVIVEASPLVEVTSHASRDGRFGWIALINHSGQNGTAFHAPVPMAAIPVRFRAPKPIEALRLLRGNRTLRHTVREDGWISCVVPALNRFEIVLYEH